MTFTANIKDIYRTSGYWTVVLMLLFWLVVGDYWR